MDAAFRTYVDPTQHGRVPESGTLPILVTGLFVALLVAQTVVSASSPTSA